MKTKRIIGMLAAVLAFAVLMVAAAVPAFADPLQPVEGNLVIHKYVNDGKDYGPNNGTLLTGSDVPKSEAINGVIFNIYKIDGVPASGPGVVYKFDETASKLTVYADVNATTPVGTYDVTLATSVTTADDGSADSGLLDQGYYLVVEDVLGSEPVDA
ncbi:MAG: pilin N-terminal domain-containing protein, partial [Coriobacteriia bacterium]|nr:pilin N-terminal domain-containing protein [Coriobacteriia bacterium]